MGICGQDSSSCPRIPTFLTLHWILAPLCVLRQLSYLFPIGLYCPLPLLYQVYLSAVWLHSRRSKVCITSPYFQHSIDSVFSQTKTTNSILFYFTYDEHLKRCFDCQILFIQEPVSRTCILLILLQLECYNHQVR